MEALTGYHEKIVELTREIVEHGFGEIRIEVKALKDNTVRIMICAGCNYAYIVEREIDLKKLNLF